MEDKEMESKFDYIYEDPAGEIPQKSHVQITPGDLVRICVSTVACGVFVALSGWALVDMRKRRRKIALNNGFFLVLSNVLALLTLLETVEFIFIYDFMFFQKMDWSDHQHNQWLAFFIEYVRMTQLGLVLATGVHQTLSHLVGGGAGLVGIIFRACLFLGLSVLLPTFALLMAIHSEAANSLAHFSHPTLVPLATGLCVFCLLFFVSRKQLLRLNPYDVLSTKIILVWQLLIVLQAVTIFSVDLLCHLNGHHCRYFVNTTEDLYRPLYPLAYLLLFRRHHLSYKFFPCLHDKDGAHRLPSYSDNEEGHEMQVGLAFPSDVFSLD